MYVLEATARVANRIYEREGVEVGVRIQKSRREVFDQSPMKSKLVRSQEVLQFVFEKQNWPGEANKGINRVPKVKKRCIRSITSEIKIGEIARGIAIGIRKAKLADANQE